MDRLVNFSILLKEKEEKNKWIERVRKQRFRNEKSVLLSGRTDTQSFLRDSLRISRRLSRHNFVSSLHVFTEFLARWNSRLVRNLYANHEINYAIAHSLFHLKYEFKIWIPFKGWINLFYNRPNINYLTNPPCCPRSTLHINPFFLRFSSSFSFFPLCLFSNNNLILFKRTWNELFELENYEEYEESDQTSSHIIT